jgi:tRNA 2-thiocytidine biosynthesis protein TtcA
MFSALQNVAPTHLMDATLHDFKNIQTTGVPDANGDTAFDEEEFPEAAKPLGALPGIQVVTL